MGHAAPARNIKLAIMYAEALTVIHKAALQEAAATAGADRAAVARPACHWEGAHTQTHAATLTQHGTAMTCPDAETARKLVTTAHATKKQLGDKMNKKKIYILILLFFALGAVLGYFAGKSPAKIDSAKIESLQEENARISSQVESIKTKLPSAPEMKFIPGKVKEIGHDFIVINSSIYGTNPLEDLPKSRTVLINSNTKFVIFVKKTDQEIQQDIKKYNEFLKNETLRAQINVTNPPPPSFIKELSSSLPEIKIGSVIIAYAGHDAKLEQKFTAEKVILQNP